MPDIGELIVGAYLKIILGCDVIDYNARPPGGGLDGLGEMDVIGLKFESKTAYLCEVTTHILGLLYKDNRETVERITAKHERQKSYAKRFLGNFDNCTYMFWSPVVPKGYLTEELGKISGLELIINKGYTEKIEVLRKEARTSTHASGNIFFRTLQILEHLK